MPYFELHLRRHFVQIIFEFIFFKFSGGLENGTHHRNVQIRY